MSDVSRLQVNVKVIFRRVQGRAFLVFSSAPKNAVLHGLCSSERKFVQKKVKGQGDYSAHKSSIISR